MTTFAMVGGGFRAQASLQVAHALDSVHCVGAVVRTPRPLDVPTYPSLDACLREVKPDFVLTATAKPVTPEYVVAAVDRGLPVLAETPPAPDLDGLRALWSAVGDSGLVSVAEQYLLMPSHAARAALVATGAIGRPTQVQVSSTQQYHALALIRGLLGAGRGPTTVRASRFTPRWSVPSTAAAGPTTRRRTRPPRRSPPSTSATGAPGCTTSPNSRPATSAVPPVDRTRVGGRAAQRRGGANDRAPHTRPYAAGAPADRVRPGPGRLDTEHISLGSEVLYRNPYPGRRWMDDEIAVATLLEQTASWVRGDAPAPYPLAEGMQDHQVALAIEEAADTDATVTTSTEGWTVAAEAAPSTGSGNIGRMWPELVEGPTTAAR